MFKRGHRTLAMAPTTHVSSGNVEVVAAPPPDLPVDVPRQARPEDERCDGEPALGWSIRGGSGQVVRADLPSRVAASRLLGVLAGRGAELPLTVYGPDGRPTGERLG